MATFIKYPLQVSSSKDSAFSISINVHNNTEASTVIFISEMRKPRPICVLRLSMQDPMAGNKRAGNLLNSDLQFCAWQSSTLDTIFPKTIPSLILLPPSGWGGGVTVIGSMLESKNLRQVREKQLSECRAKTDLNVWVHERHVLPAQCPFSIFAPTEHQVFFFPGIHLSLSKLMCFTPSSKESLVPQGR